ncbi:16S rRNA (cytosine(1402)-N(4))-methyltransferase RsmH [Clostridia bacterium]|nr:16S rRNA (cytosine(1402)-N(4))-methyltransferase RsmH [Clostridia bacterium]
MFQHTTVLLQETVDMLNVKKGGIYVDCTLGGGGHSTLILEKLNGSGRLIGLDQDQTAIENANKRFIKNPNFLAVRSNFRDLDDVLEKLEIDKVDGFLFDLGVSSPQLDQGERGFSYHLEAPLDMRMDQRQTLNAANIVNSYSAEKLTNIIFRYGEERWAKRIAEFIVQERQIKPIQTTTDLVRVIKMAIPKKVRQEGGHPARKTFQALRISVNDELGSLEAALEKTVDYLAPHGRLSIITFHSLEDRLIKDFFKQQAKGCTCPPDFPICVCGNKPKLSIVNRKPIVPSEKELLDNRRARSAKLRGAERIESYE